MRYEKKEREKMTFNERNNTTLLYYVILYIIGVNNSLFIIFTVLNDDWE
jgi:hypothetical protein